MNFLCAAGTLFLCFAQKISLKKKSCSTTVTVKFFLLCLKNSKDNNSKTNTCSSSIHMGASETGTVEASETLNLLARPVR